jgi:DNA-binding protein Fis
MEPKQLEMEVLSLLKLQGWTVSSETLVGHKKVDALARKSDDFGVLQIIAIEVKSGMSGCSRTDISAIYADYLPLVQARLVDFILLVTENEVSPAASTYIKETPNIRHLRYVDLLNRVINFSHYVAGLRSQFMESPVAGRYVPQHYSEGDDLLEGRILSWATSSDTQPLAVLGGYGIGKSTLASRIVAQLAIDYEKDPTNRIPILIPLSYLATDQHLEGLLGRLFTTNTNVHNYNYDLFHALNRRGRFFIVLDGFDEMKRTMSWDALRYNLAQLNQLFHERSKVILLGRPTAFMSEAEHKEALHGRRIINRQERRLPEWPDYIELHISQFSREQVKQYLNKVIALMEKEVNDSAVLDRTHKLKTYLARMDGPEGRRLVELVSRPVQLKMLVEILPDFEGDFTNLTVAILYEEFIDLVIRRELDKDSRRAFNVQTRRNFAGKLAFWLWRDNQKTEVDAEKLPDEFFKEFSKSPDDDLQAIRRDLLSGCFLERKPPNSFFFPHRSFQEYLVAERLAAIATSGKDEMQDCPFLTNEILSFFVELMGRRGVVAWRDRIEKGKLTLNDHAKVLLDTSCAYYRLASPFQKPMSDEGETGTIFMAEAERARLLERLLVGEIVSDRGDETAKEARRKGKAKSPHRLGGVTRKKNF